MIEKLVAHWNIGSKEGLERYTYYQLGDETVTEKHPPIYFKKVLAMTGTNTFTVLSTEDLEQTSGGLAVWEDGYGRCLYYREFAPYMGQGALNSYRDAWKYGFRAG